MQPQLPKLADIHLPEQVSPWPPALGWWLLAVLIIVLAVLVVRWALHAHRRRQAKRAALAHLAKLDWESPQWPNQLNGLLKQVVMAYYPLEHVAQLHSEAWSDFLAESVPKKQRDAFHQDWRQLQRARFEADSTHNLDAKTYQLWAEIWIKRALPPKGGHHV